MQDRVEERKVKKAKLMAVIEPFLNDTLSDKEGLELAHLANFVVSFDDSIKVVEKRESPDFIIEYDGNQVGLEIERLFNLEEVANIKSKEAIFNKAAIEFEKKYPDNKVLINFWTAKGYEFKGKDIEEIADFTYQLISGANPEYPPYITKTFYMKHSGVSFNYNEGVYMPLDAPETALIEAIGKKENKFATYKENTKIDNQWLLIVSSIGSHSFDFEDFELEKPIESQFEHIYLLQEFDGEIITIK